MSSYEIKNVKRDFGATGDSVTDDTAAIQAAVDWTNGANRGTIYFPAGHYLTTTPITFNYDGNLSICFRGEVGTFIGGTVDGYVFDRHLPTASVTISIASPGVITDTAHGLAANTPLRFETTGALPTGLIAGTTYYVKTVLSANTYTVSATSGGTVIATTGSQSGSHTRAPINTPGMRIFDNLHISNGHATGGCIRLGATQGGVIRNCQLGAHINITTEDAPGVSSQNINISNCQFSLSGNQTGSHHIIIGGGGIIEDIGTQNGSETGIRAYGSGLHCAGMRMERNGTCWMLGKDSADNAVGLSGFSIVSSTFEGNWTAMDFVGPCNGFFVGGLFIQGHDLDNAGPTASIQGTQYGIRIRADCARNGVISACNFGSWADVAGVSIANATSRTNLVIDCTSSKQTGSSGADWTVPTNAYTASFERCNVQPVWTYSQLPTGTDVLEGDEFDISDSTTATWGANVTVGGGSNRVRVRYNGTNYTVVGK